MKHFRLFDTRRSNVLPFLIAVVAGFLLSGLAQAAPLTDDQIRSFINSMDDTEKLGDEYPELDREDDDPAEDITRPLTSSLHELDDHPEARGKLEDIVQDHGFDSIREWADVGDRIFVAMMALDFQEMPKEQREMMRNTPAPDMSDEMYANMGEAQKAAIQRMAQAMRGAMEAAENAPKEDVEAVRPFRDELDALGEE